jgi:hypothetical protein
MTRPAQNFVSALLTAACIGLFAPAATAQQYTWTNYTYADGLGSNQVFGVYAEGDTIYAATAAGVSVSIDNGATWTNYTGNGLPNPLLVTSIYAIDCTIYAGTTGGLGVSTAILADWANIYWTNYTSSDGLGLSAVNGVYAVGDTIYAATGSIGQSGGVSVSTDNGANWTNYTTANGLGSDLVYGVYAQGDTIYAATYGGLSVSTDNGANWTNYTTANGLGNNIVNGVYAIGDTIYAATHGALSVSTDNGANWTNYTTANGLGANGVNGVYAIGSTIYAATNFGLSVSTDSGSTWTNDTYADGLGSNQLNGVYVQGDTIYAATTGGLSIGVSTAPPPPPTPTGLQFTNYSNQSSQVSLGIFEWVPYSFGSAGVIDVAVDSEGSIYLAQVPCTQCSPDPMVGGLSISDDGGCTWTNYTTDDGLPSNNLNCISLDDSGNIYVGSDEGVSISEDGGLTWTTYSAANGLVDAPVIDIAVDNGTIYATCLETVNTQVGGLSISDDGGKSWSIIDGSNGLPNDFTIAVVAQDGLVYVTNAQLQTGNFKNWSSAGGLSISSDGGQSWVTYNSSNGLAGNSAVGVTVDDGVIYVSTQSSGFPYQGVGVSSSSDGGTTWTILTQDWSSSDAAYDIEVAGGWLYVSADIDGTYGFYSYPLFVPQCTPTSWTMLTDGLIFDDEGGSLYANGDSLYATQSVEVYDRTTGITTLTGGFMVLDSVPQQTFLIDNLSSVDVAHGVICVGSTDAGVSVSSGPITSADSISWISASTSNGLGSNYVTSVQVGEDFLAAGTTGGVSVSTDGGFCWTNSTTADGLADDEVLAVFVFNGSIYAATSLGLSISTDQGASWTSPKSTLGLPLSDVYVETVLYQGQLVDAVYLAVGGGTPVGSFDGLATTIELNNQCGDYPYGTPSPYYLVVQGGKIYGFDGVIYGDAVVSEACDPSCDYECGWSEVPPWCGYVTDIELVGPDRWFATPTAGGLSGGLVFNPEGVTYSSCGTATRTFTIADGLGSNNCIAVSVGDGLVCVATDSGVSVGSLGQCPGDFDLDGIIGGDDLARVLAFFGNPCDGSTPEACVLDLDGSGIVDAGDIAVLLEAWGSCE